jgi:molybdopterin-guanine dinucleotide biosynthesis protein A
VLVGGRSSRMGRDKALLPFRGGVLAQSVARAVALAAGSATLAGNPARYAHLGYRVISDLYPGQGPLGGILTALHDTQSDWNLITACDLPNLSASFLSDILETARNSTADALLPEGPAGLEPLCAVYHRRSLAGLEAAFTRGVRKIKDALPDISLMALPAADLMPLRNANTPEEWSRHAAFE